MWDLIPENHTIAGIPKRRCEPPCKCCCVIHAAQSRWDASLLVPSCMHNVTQLLLLVRLPACYRLSPTHLLSPFKDRATCIAWLMLCLCTGATQPEQVLPAEHQDALVDQSNFLRCFTVTFMYEPYLMALRQAAFGPDKTCKLWHHCAHLVWPYLATGCAIYE